MWPALAVVATTLSAVCVPSGANRKFGETVVFDLYQPVPPSSEPPELSNALLASIGTRLSHFAARYSLTDLRSAGSSGRLKISTSAMSMSPDSVLLPQLFRAYPVCSPTEAAAVLDPRRTLST